MEVLMVVLPSLLTGAVTLIVCIINNNAARQKQLDDFKQILAQQKSESEKTVAIMNLKIEELTKQVEAHNNLIKRTYDLEKLAVQYDAIIKGLEKRLEKVEK
jgi:hypothetical protein